MALDTNLLPYAMKRADVKRVINLKVGTWDRATFQSDNDGDVHYHSVTVQRDRGFVRIGCQRFTGRDFSKLYKWARGR